MVKQDVRLQIFVTSEMDDRISDMAELMGMRKNELIRTAIATYIAQWNKSVEIVGDMMKDPKILEQLMSRGAEEPEGSVGAVR